jgi:hypothetical protein
MKERKIKGLTKAEFIETCIAKANEINPNWEREIFQVENFVPKVIWQSASPTSGLALSGIGAKFFNDALKLKPYFLDTKYLTSREIIKLAAIMPWPYAMATFPGVLTTRIAIYSAEVAVWAALYDNDLDKLLEAYSRT